MIDLSSEELLSFTAVSRLPELDRPSIATLYRWSSRGVSGVRLESVRIGGKRLTSRQAVQRFVARVTEATQLGQADAAPTVPIDERRAAKAEAELAKAGI